ncbi:amidohydrolase family protein [Aliikangiella marina]|uniref:Amidohydrolase family protein n=1 Tax=Aliikangiella marina TaxID=1712262 RepID=A0A545T4I2_9GAMM|nr:amidohydrolase family protein [Aliikangiella marina]TQV72136.1 amidohydrolase family protein [Aliikangiella marina]
MNFKSLITACLVSLATATAASEKHEGNKWDVNNPPGEAYQANIEVNEGTWMNISVSPDGETIAFDLLGDIYTLPIKGGKAKALTKTIAWEMQPQFSPDGKQIVFTSDAGGGDNIWLMDRDGTNQRQLTKESFRLLNSPTWSPDGQYIAARKHFTSRRSLGAGEIWLYHTAGGKGLQLNKRPNDQKDLGEPAFSANGKKVFFSRDSTPGKIFEYSKDSNQVIYEIFSIDRLTGEIKKEISGFGGSVRPTPSPDGNLIAFVRRIRNQSSLFLKDLNTGEEFPIYQKLDRDMQETWAIHGVYPTLAWTPDSENLIFWAGGKIRKLNITTQVAEEIPFQITTSKAMRKAVKSPVNPSPDKFDTRMLRWVQVSPDGDQVVFQALGQLYTRKLPNGKPKRLTKADNEFEFYPSYSPDGDYIIYATWNDQQQGAIKKVRARGGKGTKLTKSKGKYIAPKFSPDGKQVIYQKITGGWINSPLYDIDPAVYRMDAKGGNNQLVTKNGRAPFFANSMDRIYLTRSQGQKISLVSVDLNGQDPITHATTQYANEFSLSANQKYLVFRERYQLYVTPFTHAAQAIELSPKSTNLPLLKVSTEGGQYVSWSNQDAALNWSLGSTLYRLTLPDPKNWKDDQSANRRSIELGFKVNSDIPRGSTLFIGAKIITMKGYEVINEGDILITGNRIKAIGETGTLSVPDNAKRINARGKTIIPGLVDVHWHGRQGTNQITPQQNWYNLATLAFGVTTLHDPSNNTQQIFSAAELAESGKIVAPRIFSTGTILYGAEASITAEINSLEDADDHLKRLKAQGAFSVKSYNQPRRDQRQQVLQAARNNQMMVMPEGGSTFQHNLTMIVDGHTGIEHSIPVAKIYDDVKQLWSQSETAYTPTLTVAFGGIWGENYWYQHSEVWKHPLLSKLVPKSVLYPRSIRRTMAPKEDYNHINNATVAAELQDLGVKVHIGAHGQREGLGAHWEMWMFAQGGMTPLEVIRASTIDGARYLGMEQHLGSLEVGKLADLVVLDIDPIESIYETDKVNMVMKNGRLYDSQTMNEIGNHPKKRAPMFFE